MTNTIIILLRVLAVALLGAAAYFYTAGEQDRIFAAVVLSACSFFLSLRFSFREKVARREAAADEDDGPTKFE